MATLILTTVGTAIGGPIGGAIGAVLGNQLDRRLLAPKGRQGPRLGDLSVQTSSYGSAIPRLFGTMRVAGTVIWATDLREDVHRAGGGKGGAKTTAYSYSASFAVALSARPIRRVARIWADGKLLRGAAGDWKSETGFRLYLGDEAQPIDPLIASAEGIASTPAHRGIAYAVFDALQLADFGNRIPSLTFEVVADEGSVAVAAVAGELTDGMIAGESGATLDGFAATGDSARGALEALAQAYPMPLADDGAVLRIGAEAVHAIDPVELGTSARANGAARRTRTRQAGGQLPDEVALGYYEPARDHQAGLQRARRDGIGRRAERIDLAAALGAGAARALAEEVLARRWTGRERLTIVLPWRRMGIGAGTRVELDGIVWRVAERNVEGMIVELELRRDVAGIAAVADAAAGRATGGNDLPAGATTLLLLDLPAIDGTLADTPRLYLAAAGAQAGWRRAEINLTFDGGANWQAAGRTAAPAVIGRTIDAPGPGEAGPRDRQATVELLLLNDGMALAGADEARLTDGANLALVGDELVQFGRAEQIGVARWRIGDLLRGRFGSEGAIGAHVAGERFVLLDPATLLALDVPRSKTGTTLQVSGMGVGDGDIAAGDAIEVIGQALFPPAPVGLRAIRRGDGAIEIGWTRRSRIGWSWSGEGEMPLGEDRERYLLRLQGAGGASRRIEVDAPMFVYPPADQIADGWSGSGALRASVGQIGTHGGPLHFAEATWQF